LKKIRIDINPVIRFVFLTNSFSFFALGLVVPFIAVFASSQIEGGNIAVAGIAAGISPFLQGIFQICGGWTLDRLCKKSERYPFYFFVAQQLANSLYLLLMAFVSSPVQLYFLQAGRGITTGFTLPAGNFLQAKYMSKDAAGLAWGISGAIFNIFYGLGGIIAGLFIARFGFQALFFTGAGFYFLASILAWRTLKKYTNTTKKDL
jgi:MFS family permease